MRTWQQHDVGTTPGFGGDTEKALRSIVVPVLYMPSETDLYFPVGDARQESRWIRKVTFAPIPSLWGHPAGCGRRPRGPRVHRAKAAGLSRDALSGGPCTVRGP